MSTLYPINNKNKIMSTNRVTLELSIRRKNQIGLPGDDPTLHNVKIGSSLHGQGPLRGLSYDEEIKYLPEVIGISPTDNEWRKSVIEYWHNISVPVPADGVAIGKLEGKPLTFTIEFKTSAEVEAFNKVVSFEKKAELAERGEVIKGVSDYILWRYCLVYGRVANRAQDVNRSPKILFYLYSKENETKIEHAAFTLRSKASTLFASILTEEKKVNAVLLMYGQDLTAFDTLADKHLSLEALIKVKPAEFIGYVEDGNLAIKSAIKKAVANQILRNPANTTSYYYGDNNEVLLGTTLTDTVLYFKSEEKEKVEIINAIKARLKQI